MITLAKIWTLIVVTTGFVLFIVGALLLVLPGPGWLVIILALTILAGHFVWAARLLKEIKSKLSASKKFLEAKLFTKK